MRHREKKRKPLKTKCFYKLSEEGHLFHFFTSSFLSDVTQEIKRMIKRRGNKLKRKKKLQDKAKLSLTEKTIIVLPNSIISRNIYMQNQKELLLPQLLSNSTRQASLKQNSLLTAIRLWFVQKIGLFFVSLYHKSNNICDWFSSLLPRKIVVNNLTPKLP